MREIDHTIFAQDSEIRPIVPDSRRKRDFYEFARFISTNGVGNDDDPSSDEGNPNCDMLPANRSLCKGCRVRNSGSLRSDRTGRTSLDCKLRAAPKRGWQARLTGRERQVGLPVSSWRSP